MVRVSTGSGKAFMAATYCCESLITTLLSCRSSQEDGAEQLNQKISYQMIRNAWTVEMREKAVSQSCQELASLDKKVSSPREVVNHRSKQDWGISTFAPSINNMGAFTLAM